MKHKPYLILSTYMWRVLSRGDGILSWKRRHYTGKPEEAQGEGNWESFTAWASWQGMPAERIAELRKTFDWHIAHCAQPAETRVTGAMRYARGTRYAFWVPRMDEHTAGESAEEAARTLSRRWARVVVDDERGRLGASKVGNMVWQARRGGVLTDTVVLAQWEGQEWMRVAFREFDLERIALKDARRLLRKAAKR